MTNNPWPVPFGFKVEFCDDQYRAQGWIVQLPHQCDDWRIDAYEEYAAPSGQTEALAALDAFIAEAQQARAALAASREYPPEEEQR